MKLSEAIEIKKTDLGAGGYAPESKEEEALKLLIEAGKRIDKGRATFDEYYATLLPGETVD